MKKTHTIKTEFGYFCAYDRTLSKGEIMSLAKYEGNYNDISIIRQQKSGFWNQVFRNKEIIVYINGTWEATIDDFIGTVNWWTTKI